LCAHIRHPCADDFVKIKVRLGSQLEHYYILSRFLLSRMLTVITLPQHKVVDGDVVCVCGGGATDSGGGVWSRQ
jgi:hypothetical protein